MRKRWYAAAAAAALALLLVSADTASAQRWGRWGGWAGGYYGGWRYGPGWGYGYRPGYGGWGYGYAPGYWSGSYYPSYSYTGVYSYPAYGIYSYPTYGMAYGASETAAPTSTTSMYYEPGTQISPAGFGRAVDNNAALIEVRVPPVAQVTFDGEATRQQGPDRIFSSPSLEPGKNYHYDVKARWTENGKPMEQTRRVEVRAGQRTTVDFTQSQGGTED
jgi:uncharacterized protein (TIGR03000 family)